MVRVRLKLGGGQQPALHGPASKLSRASLHGGRQPTSCPGTGLQASSDSSIHPFSRLCSPLAKPARSEIGATHPRSMLLIGHQVSPRIPSSHRRTAPQYAPHLREAHLLRAIPLLPPSPSASSHDFPVFDRRLLSSALSLFGRPPDRSGSTIAAVHLSPFAHSLSRLSFGSNSPARRHSSKGCYAGSPASVSRYRFRLPRATPARRNPPRDPPKIPLRRLPSAPCRSPRLRSGDLSLLVARDRWAPKEKRNVPQQR